MSQSPEQLPGQRQATIKRLHVVGDPQHDHLQALARAVEAIAPLRAWLVQATRNRPAVLHVLNPDAGHLSEDVCCRIEQVSGEYWYFWSWSDGHSDTIGPADDPDGVAQAIAHVLTPQARGRFKVMM